MVLEAFVNDYQSWWDSCCHSHYLIPKFVQPLWSGFPLVSPVSLFISTFPFRQPANRMLFLLCCCKNVPHKLPHFPLPSETLMKSSWFICFLHRSLTTGFLKEGTPQKKKSSHMQRLFTAQTNSTDDTGHSIYIYSMLKLLHPSGSLWCPSTQTEKGPLLCCCC